MVAVSVPENKITETAELAETGVTDAELTETAVTDPETVRRQRFARLPEATRPADWVLSQDTDAAPWTIYTAPDVVEEQARRWGFAG